MLNLVLASPARVGYTGFSSPEPPAMLGRFYDTNGEAEAYRLKPFRDRTDVLSQSLFQTNMQGPNGVSVDEVLLCLWPPAFNFQGRYLTPVAKSARSTRSTRIVSVYISGLGVTIAILYTSM